MRTFNSDPQTSTYFKLKYGKKYVLLTRIQKKVSIVNPNPKLLQNLNIAGFEQSGVKHNIYQWDYVYDNNDFFKGGWAGQGLLINPTRDVVAVFTGYKKNEEHHAMEMRGIIREVLNGVFD